MDNLCCAQRPKKGIRTGQDPFAAALAQKAEPRSSNGDSQPVEELNFAGRALSLFGGPKKAKPKATDDDGLVAKTMSFMTGGGKKASSSSGLPPNWTKSRDIEGKECYVNSVTKITQYTEPRPLPKGWVEALHKESGRPMYKNAETRQTLFTFPPDEESDSSRSGRDAKGEEENFIGKTMSFMTGGAKKVQAGLTKSKGSNGAAGGEKSPRPVERVFISATSLIKEVKLCVGPQQQPALEQLGADLAARKITAEQAIPKLQALVGNTLVQQAAICVQNLKTGTLPHGWIEYADPATKRNYYYNAHTKETTWHKPKQVKTTDATSDRAENVLDMPEGEDAVGVDYTLSLHEIKVSAEL